MVLGLIRIPAKLKIKSCAGSKRGHSSWPGSSHRSHSPPWSPHTSHSPLCHSWSRSRLAHSSTRACSSRQAHSSWSRSPHSWSHSPHSWSRRPHSWNRSLHSWSHSPHSWSRSLRNSHSSPWFWWIEGGVGQRSRWRERRCSGVQSPGPGASIYLCRVRCDAGHMLTSLWLFL